MGLKIATDPKYEILAYTLRVSVLSQYRIKCIKLFRSKLVANSCWLSVYAHPPGMDVL